MRCTLPWSVGSKSTHKGELGFLLTLLVAQAAGCGRIPPLYDAALRAPTADTPLADETGGARGDLRLEGVGGRGGQGGATGGTASCSGVVLSAATRQSADVLLVLDRSGSMNFSMSEECSCDPTANPLVVCADTSNCTTRWSSLVTTLDNTISSTPLLHWGLKLFSSPSGGGCQVASGVEVPIAANAAAAIQAEMEAITPAGETPTAAAITAATAYLETQNDANSKILLLATDGKPDCGGAEPSVYEDDTTGTLDAIAAAVRAGFLVYVIGIGTGTSKVNLDTFAQVGGTDKYYPAQSADELTKALASISQGARCAFALASTPPDPNQVAVYLDKNMVPQDASYGWSFGASSQTILLHGSFCDQALSEPPDAVQVLFGCGHPLPPVLP